MSYLMSSPPRPTLTPLDGDTSIGTIEFQFQPGNPQETVGANWASATAMGRQHPILQYSHGEQQTFTFEARLFARDATENIEDKVQALKDSIAPLSSLKRPPRWDFTWGSVIQHETVVVQSIGGIQYDQIRPDGTLRGAILNITLLVYRSVDVELSGQPLPSTFYGVTKSGDQWEDIALREYGDPIMGDLLRRLNPSLPFPGMDPGKVVKLPPPLTLRDEIIEPNSQPLRRTADSLALRASLFESRSQARESVVLLR